MKKHVLSINGSAHPHGNTQTIIEAIHKGAIESKYTCDTIHLSEYNLKYCTSCKSCESAGHCPLDDGFMDIVKRIKEANVILFASPIWHHGVTGLMKVFTDRLNTSQLEFTVHNGRVRMRSRIPGKRGAALLNGCTQQLSSALPPLDCVLRTLEFNIIPHLLFPGIGLTDEETAKKMPHIIELAYQFGKAL